MDGYPEIYNNVLFNDVTYTQFQFDYALEPRNKWREDYRIAIEWKEANDGDNRMRMELSEYTRSQKQVIWQIPKPEGGLYEPMIWVSAYWNAYGKKWRCRVSIF